MRLLLILLAILVNDPKEIAKVNALKKEAEAAYLAGDYELAISKYNLLTDSIGIDEDQIKLNLGHAHYHLGDTAGAKMNYGKVGASDNKKLRSIAYQQLGVMSKDAGKLEQALQQLKTAIKADPSNKDAIYDYEVVKKLLEEQKKQEQENKDKQNQDQENKDGEDEQKNEEKKDGEKEDQEKKEGENQEKSDQEKQDEQKEQEQKEGEQEEQEQEKSQEEMTKEKLEEMGISEEKARQLLEAMRQSEIKYLQNQKRKATKRPPSGKPDW